MKRNLPIHSRLTQNLLRPWPTPSPFQKRLTVFGVTTKWPMKWQFTDSTGSAPSNAHALIERVSDASGESYTEDKLKYFA